MRRAAREESFDDLFGDAEPPLEPGDYVFVHDTARQHLVWQVTRTGRPVVLMEGRFRALPRDEYLPLAGGHA
jgi:hypothetical protein